MCQLMFFVAIIAIAIAIGVYSDFQIVRDHFARAKHGFAVIRHPALAGRTPKEISRRCRDLMFAVLMVACSVSVSAPAVLNYQARLLNSGGQPITGTHVLT